MEQNPTAPQTNEIHYAGFWRRFCAYWVDALIIFPITLVLQNLLGMNPFAIFSVTSTAEIQQLQNSNNYTSLFSLALTMAFSILLWVNSEGATPGKKIMGIKVQKNDGSKINYPTAIIRYLGYFVSTFVFGLGHLWIAWDKKKQGWHDKIAGTVVVKSGEKPKTALGIFLAIIAFILMSGYLSAAFVKGVMIGIEEAKSNKHPAKSQQQYKDSMSPEAKKHYDTTQELYGQIRAAGNNVQAIQPIANKIIAESKLAIDADPNNPILWANLGDAYTWPNTVDTTGEEGLKAYQKALEIDPNNVIYSNYVGDQLIRMEKYEEAVLQLKKSLRLNENSGFAHMSLGQAYMGLKINAEARTHFEEAIKIFEKHNNNGQFDDEILGAQKAMGMLK